MNIIQVIDYIQSKNLVHNANYMAGHIMLSIMLNFSPKNQARYACAVK